ncbi:hypothetical protein A3D78_06660 [Candidatus Gottesmanbacteria bacterium RIFCSPHIGHO2_02_FULL_39_14]|uniref:isopentenyl-diphosphate Delta-isomerase n=2 Tax=Candidatus Gottesmaniibacteriota TaxID=1752720 RepID=A0A1F5ZZF0_9BACT|nr:MAG: hypothetical protein A3D78_06660 [Candidatus Gottesmanbacteria bacterium RIFCSPHIGHO2_02_FULL_39_14]OGG31805.1 MAG: hypothetical protein A3I51_02200 [Candidatus Gottesmanbacteria bacterium RIFCSPLOWO2_02_FULL_38_8]
MSKFHNLSGERKLQLLVLCDRQGHPLGTATRQECHQGEGKTHLAFIAFIVNSRKEILLTQRGRYKSLWPLYWDASTISHILPGETVEQAANRRGKEELGVDAQFQKIGSFFYTAKYLNRAENEYCYVLITKTDTAIDPNPKEIAQYKMITINNLKQDIKLHPNKYTPWLRIALNKI